MDHLLDLAKQCRRDIVTMVHAAQAGHPGGSLSEIDILVALYDRLRIDPRKPQDPGRDRFILSKGHASPGLYSILARKGFFSPDEFSGFRKLGRMLQGHTDIKVPGVEMSAGSLGMGLSFGVGCALAARIDKRDYRTWVMVGDGETQEGQVWEAAMNASYHALDNLSLIVDKNRIQNDDFVEITMLIEPLKDRFLAFGWAVTEIDGHDMAKVLEALDWAEKQERPSCIIAHTVKGKGVSFMEDQPRFHGMAPSDEEYKKVMEELR